MVVGEKLKEKEFKGNNAKDAYLKACKWISSNILAVNNSEHICYRIYKTPTVATVKVVIYLYAEEEEVKDRQCDICREMSRNFFMQNNKHKCESCSIPPYRRRLKSRIDGLKEVIKGRIKL